MASSTKSLGTIGLLLLSALSTVDAHAHVESPASRQEWCNQRANTDFGHQCGAVQYEPQSVEAPSGAPFGREVGDMVCSGGVPNRPDLDGVDNYNIPWPSTSVPSGQDIEITWNYHAPHSTKDWHYYITKPGWTRPKDRGLRKEDFVETPIHKVEGNGFKPEHGLWNQTLPGNKLGGQTGDITILAVWEIADTTNSFYSCIDLNVQSGHDHGSQPDPGQGVIQFPSYVGSFGLECTWKPVIQNVGRRLKSSWRH